MSESIPNPPPHDEPATTCTLCGRVEPNGYVVGDFPALGLQNVRVPCWMPRGWTMELVAPDGRVVHPRRATELRLLGAPILTVHVCSSCRDEPPPEDG